MRWSIDCLVKFTLSVDRLRDSVFWSLFCSLADQLGGRPTLWSLFCLSGPSTERSTDSFNSFARSTEQSTETCVWPIFEPWSSAVAVLASYISSFFFKRTRPRVMMNQTINNAVLSKLYLRETVTLKSWSISIAYWYEFKLFFFCRL